MNKMGKQKENRHIVELGLTLLAQAPLPLTFWWIAFFFATYLINRLPTPVLLNQSPYQKLFKTKPVYKFLKVFGCTTLRPYNHHKLEFRSSNCLFLGYSPQHKGTSVSIPLVVCIFHGMLFSVNLNFLIQSCLVPDIIPKLICLLLCYLNFHLLISMALPDGSVPTNEVPSASLPASHSTDTSVSQSLLQTNTLLPYNVLPDLPPIVSSDISIETSTLVPTGLPENISTETSTPVPPIYPRPQFLIFLIQPNLLGLNVSNLSNLLVGK